MSVCAGTISGSGHNAACAPAACLQLATSKAFGVSLMLQLLLAAKHERVQALR
jgi:hypothetical protein